MILKVKEKFPEVHVYGDTGSFAGLRVMSVLACQVLARPRGREA